MTENETGGDPACWAHLFESDEVDAPVDASKPMVVDLDIEATGSGGAVWSLPHGGDLDANLVRLDPGGVIGEHVNREVDVLMLVQSGDGTITVNAATSPLGPNNVGWIPKGAARSIAAGAEGITYMSVHKRRGGLGIANRGGAARP